MASGAHLGILVALSFLPPLLLMIWIRNHEKRDREPMRTVLAAFIFGGTTGVAVAILLSQLFGVTFGDNLGFSNNLLALVFLAPIVEELSKGLGLGLLRKHLREPEDGIVYGAAVGFGFAAMENLFYGLDAFVTEGLGSSVEIIVLRVFSSTFLHASATAILGFGYGLVVLRGGVAAMAIPFYVVAVALHTSYNFLVTLKTGETMGFAFAVTLALGTMWFLRNRIKVLDALPHDH